MIKVGQKVKFNPFIGHHSTNGDITLFNNTEGTVKYVNSRNRWFSVEWGEPKMIISFNFNDIGNAVKLAVD